MSLYSNIQCTYAIGDENAASLTWANDVEADLRPADPASVTPKETVAFWHIQTKSGCDLFLTNTNITHLCLRAMKESEITRREAEENIQRFLTFTGATKPKPNALFILVMGMTGAGKSSFVAACTGQPATIGHGLESCKLALITRRVPFGLLFCCEACGSTRFLVCEQ